MYCLSCNLYFPSFSPSTSLLKASCRSSHTNLNSLFFLMFRYARKWKVFTYYRYTLSFIFFIIWTASSNLWLSISSSRENLIFWNSIESVCHQFCYQLYCQSNTHNVYTTGCSVMTFFYLTPYPITFAIQKAQLNKLIMRQKSLGNVYSSGSK